MLRYVFLGMMLSASAVSIAEIPVSAFAEDGISSWKEKVFAGHTSYQAVTLDGLPALKAESNVSASGLYHEQRIDLYETPYLNWQWRIENKLIPTNEKNRAGDDYAARLYVVVDGGLLYWKTLALSYVWSASAYQDESWDNAFAGDSVRMLALRTRDNQTSQWHSEKRNVYEDLMEQFGKDVRYIDAVAVMTDIDNSKGQAVAYYADIFFSHN